jgi:REP element-mobilizing transposase RayT
MLYGPGLRQRHSENVLLVHIVWATHRRARLLSRDADAWLAEVLRRKARDAGTVLLACGNADDHVHVLVRYPSTVTVANVVQRLKGASSYAWNTQTRWPRLAWQAGSWAQSVSPSGLEPALRYVDHQRHHHGEGAMVEPWEIT